MNILVARLKGGVKGHPEALKSLVISGAYEEFEKPQNDSEKNHPFFVSHKKVRPWMERGPV